MSTITCTRRACMRAKKGQTHKESDDAKKNCVTNVCMNKITTILVTATTATEDTRCPESERKGKRSAIQCDEREKIGITRV